MIPYPYNMVDMGGIDLAEANGIVVPGLYSKIVEAVNACGDVVLYNWKFAGIEIAPQHTSILLGDPITINGAVQVTEQDVVTVPGLSPDPPVLVPLNATENGDYSPADYDADGFSEVSVEVVPVLVPLSVTEDGNYNPADYDADGFSVVSVNVTGEVYNATHVWTQSVGGYDASLNVQEGIISALTFTPTSEVINVVYNTVQSTERLFEQVGVSYRNAWIVRALEKLSYGLPATVVNENGTVSWIYSASVNYIFYFK